MADIANLSGYSKASVSFAFSRPEKIGAEAYKKIMAAAVELDYLPDPMARNLSKGRLKVIGFLIPQGIGSTFDNPFIIDVMQGIGEVSEEEGCMLTVVSPLHSSLLEAVKSAMVDGVITMGLAIDAEIRDVLRKRHLPVVSIDGNVVEGVLNVQIDDELAAETQIRRALEKGHRKFAILALGKSVYDFPRPNEPFINSQRLKGYAKALAAYGLSLEDQVMIGGDPTFEQGEVAAEEIFNNHPSVTCIICMADITGYGILSKARKMGVAIPERCSLVGFDGIGAQNSSLQVLTTIRQSGHEKGRIAARELFALIKGCAADEDRQAVRYVPFSFEKGATLIERA